MENPTQIPRNKLNLNLRSKTKFIVLILLYIISMETGLFSAPHIGQHIIWPAAGVGVGVLCFFGLSFWPTILLAAVLDNFFHSVPLLLNMSQSVGFVMESLLATMLIEKIFYQSGKPAYQRKPFTFLFASLVPSVIPATLIYFSGTQNVWYSWWSGDVLGIISLTPLIYHIKEHSPWSPRVLETFGFYALVLFSSVALFVLNQNSILLFFIFPLLLFISNRLAGKEVKTCALIISVVSTWATIHKYGPFTFEGLKPDIISLQVFLFVLFFSALILSSLRILETRKISEGENNFREMADTMPQIVWWNDPLGRVQYYNKRWYEFSGQSTKKFSFFTSLEIIHEDDKDKIAILWNQSLKNIHHFEAKLRLWDRHRKEYRWYLSRALPVRDSLGKIKRWYGTLTDIHEQITQYNSEQTAHESSRLKTEFLANMSHEVRTPLNIIIGITNLLEHSSPTQEQKYLIENLKKSGSSLKNLVTDILDLSKIEVGRVEVESIPLYLVHVLKEVISSFTMESVMKGIHLELIQKTSLPEKIYGDETKIRQILANLISNAIKFSKKGNIYLVVESTVKSSTDGLLTFKVIDQGIGIDSEKINKLFKPFTQADASTNRLYGGTGLGLSISKGLVENMNGTIAVESSAGEGSTFWFTLPYQVVAEEHFSGLKSENYDDLLGMRILVAEDNEVNSQITRSILERQGAVICVAENGLKIIEELENGEFDLILMDCHMPVMDGYKTTETIRKSERFEHIKKIPILALSANASKVDRKRCLTIGMNGYLSKPVTAMELGRAIRLELLGPEIIDDSALLKLRAFDEKGELLKEVISSFHQTSAKGVQKIENLFFVNNITDLKREAHSLKSSALSIGARYLAYIARHLEMMPVPKLQKCEWVITKLKEEVIKVNKELTEKYC